MKSLYLECYSGISGDMTVAALLDAGADREVLCRALDSLQLDGYTLNFGRRIKNGISAFDFDVVLQEQDHAHVHEHPHLHAHGEDHPHVHCHAEEGKHIPIEVHGHEHHAHSHVHRSLGDILLMIEAADLTDRAKSLACKMFGIVAEAEGKVHGLPPEQVHFHEVGAVDSIVDIVATAVCVDNLGIERVHVSPLYEGNGYVRCQHGLMPVPAPATAEILRAYHIPVKITKNTGEMVTPTGAAIVAALADSFEQPDGVVFDVIGLGSGKKDFACANILRAYVYDDDPDTKKKTLTAL